MGASTIFAFRSVFQKLPKSQKIKKIFCGYQRICWCHKDVNKSD